MNHFLSAAGFLIEDFAGTLLFLAVFGLTQDMAWAAAAGVMLSIAQVGWRLVSKRGVDALQWVSFGLVVTAAFASFMTKDPRFVMLKPSVIYLIVGGVMLKRNWMARYMPKVALEKIPDMVVLFGYVWAGLMFASAALNVALALTLPPGQWALAMAVWGPCSKLALFLIQFPVMKLVGRRRYLRALGRNPFPSAAA